MDKELDRAPIFCGFDGICTSEAGEERALVWSREEEHSGLEVTARNRTGV